MFCTNCGDLLDDGAVFCTKCGQRVVQTEEAQAREEAAAAQAEMTQVREEAAAVQAEMAQAREEAAAAQAEMAQVRTEAEPIAMEALQKPVKGSKKKWLWIALAAVLVVVLAVGLANFKVLANSMRKLVMSPQEYYAYLEKNAVEEMAAGYVELYDKSLGAYGDVTNQSIDYSLDVELGELICDLLGSSLELEDASGLSKIGVDLNLSLGEKLFFGELAARLDDDRLISVNAVADMETAMVYAQLPELSASYISADISENAEQITAAVEEYAGMMDIYPAGEVLESIINRYAAIIIDSFAEVTEEKAVVAVGEMEQNSTKLCASMTGAEVIAMTEHILTEAKADEELLEVLVDFVNYAEGMDEAEIRAELLEAIDDYLANAETYKAEADADSKLTMSIWVNQKGEVIGRELAINESELMISYQMPEKGKEYGLQAQFAMEETVVELLGTGTQENGDMTGTFVVKLDSPETGELELFDVTLEHLNLDKWEEGLGEMTCRIKPKKELYSELGLGAAASLLVGYELIYEVNSEDMQATTSFTIANGEALLFKLAVFAKVGDAKDVTVPTESILMETDEDLLEWMMTIDFDGFMENLSQSDMPAELVELIEAYVSEFEAIMSYDEL